MTAPWAFYRWYCPNHDRIEFDAVPRQYPPTSSRVCNFTPIQNVEVASTVCEHSELVVRLARALSLADPPAPDFADRAIAAIDVLKAKIAESEADHMLHPDVPDAP